MTSCGYHVIRDPFARASLHRASHTPKECSWCCGQEASFTYTWEDDTDSCPPRFLTRPTRQGETQDQFCDIDCWKAYTT
jgi:hypothetical protein